MDSWAALARDTGLIHFVDVNADALAVLDVEGALIECNDAFQKLVTPNRTLSERNWVGVLIEPDHLENAVEHLERAVAGETVRFLVKGRQPDGRALYADVTIAPLFDGEGGVSNVLVAAREATSTSRHGVGHDAADALMRIASRTSRFGLWTQPITQELLNSEPVTVEQVLRAVSEADDSYAAATDLLMRAVVTSSTRIDRLVEIRDKTDRPLRLRIVAEPVENIDGRLVRVEGGFFDVTVFYNQQEELVRLERMVRLTLDEMDAVVFFVSSEYTITYANEQGITFSQRSRDQVVGRNLWEVFPTMLGSDLPRLCDEALSERRFSKIVEYVERLHAWYEMSVFAAGEGIVISARNVSDSHEVVLRLEESSQRAEFLSRMVDLASDSMITRDFEHGITYLNAAAERTYGYRLEDIAGTNPIDYLYADPSQFEQADEQVRREGWWQGRFTSRARDGRLLIVDSRWQLIRDRDGTPRGVFAVNRDVTASLAEEERRTRTQRMESIGTFASGIAHDLNNVLTPVMISLEVLGRNERDPRRQELLDMMQQSVDRGSEMIRRVLTFARGVEGEHLAVDVAGVVSDVVKFCRETLPKNIDVDVEVSSRDLLVEGDRTQLIQVLLNLVTNARDAMPEGGKLVLSARVLPGVKMDLGGAPTSGGDDHVIIEVRDEGSGMDRETVNRVFEPFFTTKPMGLGSGLGLSTSQAIVRSHGGWLEIESVRGVGTTVSVIIPALRSDDVRVPTSVQRVTSPMTSGTGRVLVVDDEGPIVALITSVLSEVGYEVEDASDGEAALKILRERSFDVVLTDVNMPRMSGPELVAQLGRLGQRPHVIYISGLGIDPATLVDDEGRRPNFLAKPFTSTKLLTLVADVLTSD